MTKKEKRIAIAQDVLAQIHIHNLNVSKGTYIDEPNGYDEYVVNLIEFPDNHITKEECDNLRKSCEVCALGSMFLSRVSLYDKVQWKDLQDFDEDNSCVLNVSNLKKTLRKIFGKEQLEWIEIAFECSAVVCGYWYDHLLSKDQLACIHFGKDHNDDENRLVAIMQNIIDNNGKFNPYDRYDVVYE